MYANRKIAPQIHPIQEVVFPKVHSKKLKNGTPLHILEGGTDKIIKLEIVFKAGRSAEAQKLVAKACTSLIKEGTQNYTSEKLAEKIDFYGSTISCTSGMDTTSLTLYCIKKNFEKSLQLLHEVRYMPTFPVEELEKYKSRASERLSIQLAKNDVVAYRKITECIFGEDHCYGYNSYPESFSSINREQVVDHFNDNFTNDQCNIYLSGFVDSDILALIETHLGTIVRNKTGKKGFSKPSNLDAGTYNIAGNKLQNSIKIGRRLFDRKHKDFFSFFMMNTVLGGYFGSRLMTNIRKDKGYTYGIYSMMDIHQHDGSFYISTDVANEYQDLTTNAIKEEMDNLKNHLVPSTELQMAKNYILGDFLGMLDGPLKSSKVIKMIVENDLDKSYFEKFVESVKNIESRHILEVAQNYLSFDEMVKVNVGNF